MFKARLGEFEGAEPIDAADGIICQGGGSGHPLPSKPIKLEKSEVYWPKFKSLFYHLEC